MIEVKFITYTQYIGGMFMDETELEEDETFIDEYETREEAEDHADDDTYGTRGQFVEVYIDGKFWRDYEL